MKEAQMNLLSVNIPSKEFGWWGSLMYLGTSEWLTPSSERVTLLIFFRSDGETTPRRKFFERLALGQVLQHFENISDNPYIYLGYAVDHGQIRNAKGFLKKLARLLGRALDALAAAKPAVHPDDTWGERWRKIQHDSNKL